MEIWPALDIRDGRVARLTRGDYGRETTYAQAEEVLPFIEERFRGWPPRLHLIDLSGAREGRYQLFDLVKTLARHGVRVQTGGGLRALNDVERVLDAGAERVILGSRIVTDPAFRRQVLAACQGRAVAALDVRDGRVRLSGWTEEGPQADELWKHLWNEGWQRAIVTDIARDGTLEGIDENFWRAWSQAPGSIGAAGGIRSRGDLLALKALGLTDAIVGKAWLEGWISVEEVTALC
ncbi:MAG: 1-(5-phosphoribosyl)-5-[(5-phosphoribosylamino)methylideneamino] imidazole-4-carboxamide isomerase [Firmicutes bacterium]|nr:1-(5-phosphoribosyl)-5-[(5-phosphoribosylamino)methylideneamino] imidazole-4-carboxamide isomerase [Bacillota bacterium]